MNPFPLLAPAVPNVRAESLKLAEQVEALPDDLLIAVVECDPAVFGANADRVIDVASAELVRRLESRGVVFGD